MVNLFEKNRIIEFVWQHNCTDQDTFREVLHGYDLGGYDEYTLFSVLCYFNKLFNYESFRPFVDHGIKFVRGQWDYLDKTSKINVAELFWLYDLDLQIKFELNYRSLAERCCTKALQEKLFREIMQIKDEHTVNIIRDLSVRHSKYRYLFDMFVCNGYFDNIHSYNLGSIFSASALKYFAKMGRTNFCRDNITGAIQYNDTESIEFLLDNFPVTMFVDPQEKRHYMFNVMFSMGRSDAIKVAKIFVRRGIYDLRWTQYLSDLIGFCADHYFPGLEAVCPMVLDMIHARNKMGKLERYEWPGDMIIVCREY